MLGLEGSLLPLVPGEVEAEAEEDRLLRVLTPDIFNKIQPGLFQMTYRSLSFAASLLYLSLSASLAPRHASPVSLETVEKSTPVGSHQTKSI